MLYRTDQSGKNLALAWNSETSAAYIAALDIPDDSNTYVTLAAARDGPQAFVNVSCVFQGVYTQFGSADTKNVSMMVGICTCCQNVSNNVKSTDYYWLDV